MEENITFDFRNVPRTYQLCFLEDCPRKEVCLRHMAGQFLPEDRNFGQAIYPNMKRGEKGCRLFATGETKVMAYGFKRLFANVLSRHEHGLRTAMKQYLGGHGSYYRYHNGEKLLGPEQQEWIIQLFRRTGYNEGLEFDHYVQLYDFE